MLGGKALLPADLLYGMRPWSGEQPAASQTQHSASSTPQWNPLLWDGIAQFYPWRVHYSRALAQGSIPLWNPHQFCGTPFAANAQTAVFYPLNLLFVLFSPVRAFGVSAALHLLLAGAFTFLLARALGMGRFGATVAGVTFEFGTFMVVWLELPTLVNVATWLPLALYLILRSSDLGSFAYAARAGLALGVSVLAGHFQIASYVLGAAALWWVWLTIARARTREPSALGQGILLGLASFAVALLIAAPQILPTFELAGLSHRVREVTSEGYARYLSNAIPTRNMITLFVPDFYGNPSAGSFWLGSAADFMEYALYVGILPLVLAIVGAVFAIRWRAVGFFVTLAVLSVLFAFGTPLNAVTYYLVPGTSALGGPNRAVVLFCFSAAMLAGFGAHWFIQFAREEYAATRRMLGQRALLVGAAGFAVLFVACHIGAAAFIWALNAQTRADLRIGLGQYLPLLAILLASMAILALYTAGQIRRPLFAGLALAVIVGDLFAFGVGFNPTAAPERVYPETALTRWLERSAAGRIMPINPSWSLTKTPEAILPPNAATVYGFDDVQGYDSLFSRHYKSFVDEHLGIDSSPRENGNILFIRRLAQHWPQGMAGFVLSTQPLGDSGLKEVYDADGVRVYQTPSAAQNTYVVPLGSGGAPVSRAWVTDPGQDVNAIRVYAETDRLSRLVLAEAWYPGWRATVDGVPQPISPANGIFQSVVLEPGEHEVAFTYEPGTFVVGTFLGLVGVLAVGVAAGTALARRRRA